MTRLKSKVMNSGEQESDPVLTILNQLAFSGTIEYNAILVMNDRSLFKTKYYSAQQIQGSPRE